MPLELTPKLSLEKATIDNLRGFRNCSIIFPDGPMYLVGPNNSGKTSLLKIFDFLLNWDLSSEFQKVSDEALQLLLPARVTRREARRITLWIRVLDGRRRRNLKCDKSGLAQLRLSLRVSPPSLRANLGPPAQSETHSHKAQQVFEEIQQSTGFIHISAGRSASSPVFQKGAPEMITKALLDGQQGPSGGLTRRGREINQTLTSIQDFSSPLDAIWRDVVGRLPSGWASVARTGARMRADTLAEFVAAQSPVLLSTGSHDSTGVPPEELGSGLQSLLDLEVRLLLAERGNKNLVVAVEEPEAFLHPSAQRQLSSQFSTSKNANRLIISTHSPLFVDEADFKNIALVRDHRVSQPSALTAIRNSINSVLTQGRAAEMLFADSILLVEGEGDRRYWETLRRRLAKADKTGTVNRCFVIEVGGNERMSPFIQLLRLFRGVPLSWLGVLDCDSSRQLRRCLNDAGIAVSPATQASLAKLGNAWASGDFKLVEQEASLLAQSHLGNHVVLIAPGDLEHLMCSRLSTSTAQALIQEFSFSASTAVDLAERLGTKVRSTFTPIASPSKDPWMRSIIADQTPFSELHPFVEDVLERWVSGADTSTNAKVTWNDIRAAVK